MSNEKRSMEPLWSEQSDRTFIGGDGKLYREVESYDRKTGTHRSVRYEVLSDANSNETTTLIVRNW